ncbi:hypothetical protein D3C73_1129960 [compost metagenome]
MGIRRWKAKHFGAQRTQVNRVVVAGDLGVSPADVCGHVPLGDLRQGQRRGQLLFDGLALKLHPSAQHLALRLPERSQLIIQRRHQIEGRPLRMGLQVLHAHAGPHPMDPAHGAQHADAIAQVNQPQQRERKVPGSEQLHL